MLSNEENELLTRVGSGTPMGELFRRYWIPALLSEEIPKPDCPPARVRLLGEDLVAFRDSQGRIGLLDEHCSHRGTSLFYGRNEECGLRCIYHGWKYDVEGNVLDTPAEPPDSDFKKKIRHNAYPCTEAGGIVFTYMGPKKKMPLFPKYEWASLSQDHIAVSKAHVECNYLQAMEGEFDPAHTSFLHWNNLKDPSRLNRDPTPFLDIEETDFGLRIICRRKLLGANEGKDYVTGLLFIMPSFSIIPGSVGQGFGKVDQRHFRFWVPADDTNACFYNLLMREVPFSREERAFERKWVDDSYRKIRNFRNNYLQDRELQRTVNFSGIAATNVAEQDACATESMGPICDRTREHLGFSDKSVTALRRFLLQAARLLQESKDPPHIIRNRADNDFSHLRSVRGTLIRGVSWRLLEQDQTEKQA
jgi:nitrite reductase/ring-hydroxylating ferredoxin subunit